MGRPRLMREGDLGAYVPAAGQPEDGDGLARLRDLIRSCEIKSVLTNGLGRRLEPGMDDRQTAGARMAHFYMIPCQKADEILNA
jgi:hypothetical protein